MAPTESSGCKNPHAPVVAVSACNAAVKAVAAVVAVGVPPIVIRCGSAAVPAESPAVSSLPSATN